MDTEVKYDVAKMKGDMAEKGWIARDLAKAAAVSDMTVSRFLSGARRNNRTAKLLAQALDQDVKRYIIRSSDEAVA